MYFRDYRLSKTWLDYSLKSAVSEDSLEVNIIKSPKHLWNLHESSVLIFSDHSEEKWHGKLNSLIELWSLRGFVDTLTANENYPFGDSGDLQFSIQMELSENRKRFFEVFAPFIESPSTFKYFQKKEDRES